MSKPTVAIVGRPNVGKSTLFNRILGGRAAIVSEHAGTTRDRHFGDAEWGGRSFWLVDTGGLVPDSNQTMDKAIRHQVELALAEADVIVFVVDGRDGVHPVDQAVAEKLRRAKRPVVLAVNKLDDVGMMNLAEGANLSSHGLVACCIVEQLKGAFFPFDIVTDPVDRRESALAEHVEDLESPVDDVAD